MIIVMGLPGAGKSTVLNRLKSDYKIINYGDLMFEIEKKKYRITNRDDMRNLSIEKQRLVQSAVARALARERGKVILDTHCSINTPSGYYPGLPFRFLEKLAVSKLVYITALPKEIHERRKKDQTRVRDTQTIDEIIDHDNINRYLLATYSAFSGAPAVIIYNQQRKVEGAVARLQSLL